MLTALWNLSAAIRGYLRFYMPTNRAIDWLRTPHGLKWAFPLALVATAAYLGLTAIAIEGATRPDLGWLNMLVLPFFWNAMKFAWMAVLSLLLILRTSLTSPRSGRLGAATIRQRRRDKGGVTRSTAGVVLATRAAEGSRGCPYGAPFCRQAPIS